MKKRSVIQLRLDEDLKSDYSAECDRVGIIQSEATRQLIQAAIAYMRKHGKWFPPVLMPDIPVVSPPQLRMVAEQKIAYRTRAPGAGAGAITEHAHRK